VQGKGVGIKMPRLVVFGDSLNYGHYLKNRTKTAWPFVLGKLLNLKVVNEGIPGIGNLEILTKVLEYKFNRDDIVIIGWTYIHRETIFNKLLKNKSLSIWDNNDDSKSWINLHSDYDLAIRSGLYIHHADLFLQTLGIKYHHFFLPQGRIKRPEWINKPKNWIDNQVMNRFDFADDKVHPGITSHDRAAKEIYKVINE
jgi:lysophospholipase L1-like esterase